ncbi:MAG: tetratricopeptide repeat protein [Pseudomonadota bacterium]
MAAALEGLAHAAERGDPEAAYLMGRLHASGTHTAKDPARAEAFLRRAAEHDHVEAQHHLGLLLLGDNETDDRVNEGLAWLGAAASQGDALSAVVLGVLHERGIHGVRRNTCLAVYWYEAGEELGLSAPKGRLSYLKKREIDTCR